MMQTFWETLLVKDQALFSKINGQWTNPLADHIMPWLRTSNNWYPMYAAILAYLFFKWGKNAWKWILIVAVNIALTDQISSSFFKPFVHRLRPCADPAIMHQARLLLEHCSGGFSFTSSHAANHFGLAMFLFITWGLTEQRYTKFFFVWAGLIAFAQVYVGVHYPLDILGGALIGLVSGYGMAKAYLKWAGPIPFKHH